MIFCCSFKSCWFVRWYGNDWCICTCGCNETCGSDINSCITDGWVDGAGTIESSCGSTDAGIGNCGCNETRGSGINSCITDGWIDGAVTIGSSCGSTGAWWSTGACWSVGAGTGGSAGLDGTSSKSEYSE